MPTHQFINIEIAGRGFQATAGVLSIDEGSPWHATADVNGDTGGPSVDAVDVVLIAADGRRWMGTALIGVSAASPFAGPPATSVRIKGVGPLVEAAEPAPWDG